MEEIKKTLENSNISVSDIVEKGSYRDCKFTINNVGYSICSRTNGQYILFKNETGTSYEKVVSSTAPEIICKKVIGLL